MNFLNVRNAYLKKYGLERLLQYHRSQYSRLALNNIEKTETKRQRRPATGRRIHIMNPQIHSEEHLRTVTSSETATSDMHTLVQDGFTSDEIMSLLWLRQWYQNGGSDRTEIIRRLEFLKLLILNGKMEP